MSGAAGARNRDPLDDRGLMALRADVLFAYDARGRMVRSNEPEGTPAPRLFLGYAEEGYILRFGEAVSDGVIRRLEEIVKWELPADCQRLPSVLRRQVREVLEQDGPVTEEGGGPVYRFPEVLPDSTEAVQVTDHNLAVVRETFPWLLTELAEWWPCFAVVREGAAVSVCFSSRIGEEACEAGVETLPAFRGHGLAAAVTAAWGAAIRETGRIPLYSTAWDNLASQGVARRLGLITVGADATWA
jgi:hypothetical protein